MACVYRHIRLDKNQPFYIGIGIDKKRAYEKYRRNKYWKRVVGKTDYRVEILFDDVDYSFAKEKEIEFIEIYGRKIDGGVLCNMTKGGDGTLGFKKSQEFKDKMSERMSGNKNPHYGKKFSEETRSKMSAAAKRGSDQPSSKLSKDDVMEIRKMHKSGISQRQIAKRFNVAKTNIANIVNRKTWTHI